MHNVLFTCRLRANQYHRWFHILHKLKLYALHPLVCLYFLLCESEFLRNAKHLEKPTVFYVTVYVIWFDIAEPIYKSRMSFGKNHQYIFTTHSTTTNSTSQQPHQDEGPRSSLSLRPRSCISCTRLVSWIPIQVSNRPIFFWIHQPN